MSILKIIQEVIIIVICEMLSSSVHHFSVSDPVTATSQTLHPLLFCHLEIKQKSVKDSPKQVVQLIQWFILTLWRWIFFFSNF
jgi:hypothetical protein